MNKKIAFSSVLLLLLVALAGCTQSIAKNSATNNSATSTPTAGRGSGANRPDYGQPDRASDIRGIVKTIVGNEVDILKVEMPNRNASSTPGAQNASGTRAEAVSLTGTGTDVPGARGGAGGFVAGAGGGARGGAGAAGAAGGFGGADTNSRATMLENLKALSTGEDKVIIPVGIKMLKAGADTKTREMVEANLSDITADKMITIWLNQSVTDKKVAEFVLIN